MKESPSDGVIYAAMSDILARNERHNLILENERLRAWVKRIEAINDNPADFNVEIDNACAAALRGDGIGPR
jgi:hypothetical protein